MNKLCERCDLNDRERNDGLCWNCGLMADAVAQAVAKEREAIAAGCDDFARGILNGAAAKGGVVKASHVRMAAVARELGKLIRARGGK